MSSSLSSNQGSAANPPRPRSYPLTVDQLNRTKYFGRDFFTFYDDMVYRIQTVFFETFSNFINSDPAMMMVDMTCWAMDLLSFYLDRRSTEAYLATMRERNSVSIQTRTVGYKMYGAIPATVDLRVTLDETYAFAVTYPAGFQWEDQSGNIWESVTDLTFLAGETGPKTVTIREGETRTETFVSDGSINQRFELSVAEDLALAWESDTVYVGVTLWTRYDFIPYENANNYEANYNSKPPAIVFGDGITGNIPAAGDTITVSYIRSRGASGRILADRMDGPLAPLVIAGTTINQTVTNLLPSSGGDNAEDLRRAKALAPTVYKARDVNIIREDYIARATAYASSAYGAVSMAQAYSPRSAAGDVELATCMDKIRNGLLYYTGLIYTELVKAVGDIQLAESYLLGLDAALTSALSSITTADGAFTDISTETTDIQTAANLMETHILALEAVLDASVAALNMTAGERAAAQAQIDQIRTRKSAMESSATTIDSEVVSAKNALSSATSSIGSAQTASGLAQTRIGNAEAYIVTAQEYVTHLDDDVNEGLTCIYDHVDDMLGDDCSANLVVVPILSTDADGFYTAPTLSLIDAVQSYLDGRKEVTQTVNVVDGSFYLVPADITITLGVLRGYIGEEIVAIVDRNIRAILKKREFGLNLYKSEIHDQCDGIDGVDYSNVEITGPTTHLDSKGNLVIDDKETITLGTLAIDYVVSNPPE